MNIYNVDETALTTVQTPQKVMDSLGEQQIGAVTSAERGVLITFIAGINAIGNHIPPFLIFPRVHFKDPMITNAPAGTRGGANPSGLSNEALFLEYLDHFIHHTKASRENRILLIFDNHESHLSIRAVNKAREFGIVMLTLPPHSSNKTQPLDRTVFGPLKTFYYQELDLWLRNNPGNTFSIYNIAETLGNAFPKAFSTKNILKGFACTGIFPLNPGIFDDNDFLCSEVTKHSLSTTNSTDSEPNNSVLNETPVPSDNANRSISPEEVVPYPKAAARKITNRGRKPGCTKIATIMPEENEDADIPFAKKKGQKRRRNKPPSSTPVNESSESSSEAEGEFLTQDSDSSETFSDLENEADTSSIVELSVADDEIEVDVFVVVALTYNAGTKKKKLRNISQEK